MSEEVILENDLLRVVIDTLRGSIDELHYKPTGRILKINWFSSFTDGTARKQQTAPGFHRDAHMKGEDNCSVKLSAPSMETPFAMTKSFSLRHNEPTLYVDETVTNAGGKELEALWGQASDFGTPFIDAESRIEIPAVSYFDSKDEPTLRLRWPGEIGEWRQRSKVEAIPQQRYYLTDFEEGCYRVISPSQKLALEMRWDATKFPYCWMSDEQGWLSLAPFTGMKNALEEGHGLISIPPGGSETAHFEAKITVTLDPKP